MNKDMMNYETVPILPSQRIDDHCVETPYPPRDTKLTDSTHVAYTLYEQLSEFKQTAEAAKCLLDFNPPATKHVEGLPYPVPKTPTTIVSPTSGDLMTNGNLATFAAILNPKKAGAAPLGERVNTWLASLPFISIGNNVWLNQGYPGTTTQDDTFDYFECVDGSDINEVQAHMITRMVVESYTEQEPEEVADGLTTEQYMDEYVRGETFLGYQQYLEHQEYLGYQEEIDDYDIY